MSKAELVFVPTPGIGHLLSAVELAKHIIRRDQNISIVILIFHFPFDFKVVNAYVDNQSREADPTRLTFITLPPLSNPPDPTCPTFFMTLVELHKPLVKQVLEDHRRVNGSGSVNKLSGFILDMFCSAMMDVANELEVPSYIWFTSGASFLNLMFHFQSLAHDKGVNVPTEFSDPSGLDLVLPGFRNRVPGKVLPKILLDKEGMSIMILNHAKRYRQCKGILINTFMELETYGIHTLVDLKKDHQCPTVYPVGPILELDSKNRGGSKQEDEESIMRWLDEQPRSSVVFLCFGSMGSFDKEQVIEIANGLARAGHRFLWSLRAPPPEGKYAMASVNETYVEALPEGFLDHVAHRGKIIGWAPQVSILAHPSIGGFVSHCGWNSTLESIWFGVPMATWPMHSEQQLNAFELVKELELAVEIRMDFRKHWRTKQRSPLVTAEEIENGVNKLIVSMDEEMRQRVKETSEKSRKALEDGGSSYHSLGQFIGDVLDTVHL